MFSVLLFIIYLAFISLGLPDSLLGSAWPSMYQGLDVPLSYAGIISMIISGGTIISSLQSDRLTRKLGTGKVTMISVAMTAAALFGFSVSHSFPMLCLWAIPYGLGAGSVDASINNYVAIHYSSRHMNWLHCMWGVGAAAGPYAMAYALNHSTWQSGYRTIAVLQIGLTVILFLSLPLWKGRKVSQNEENANGRPLSFTEVLKIRGAKELMITFFCYCALEQTTGLWAASYLVLQKGIDEKTAAGYASLFYIGITAGRAFSGFISNRLGDKRMVRLGQGIAFLGICAVIFPFVPQAGALLGLILIGIGCAPIYPALLHATPVHFGEERSQAVMGMQMASAYIGTCFMPPIFGMLAAGFGIRLYPLYLAVILVLMLVMNEVAETKTKE
ncbi:MAG: MFS transporter [Eubacteriales bacterium]|nr:MFS transporter [Eubacteriales bacterium]